MALEALITDGIAHAGAGVALSLLDFITYKLTNPKTRRLEHKKECLRAIETLLDTEKSQEITADEDEEKTPIAGEDSEETPVETEKIDQASTLQKDSMEYAEQVTTVRDYLRTSGIVKLQLPVLDRMKDGLRNLVFHEKINILSNPQKLGVAFGVEVLYDIFFDFQHRAVTGIAASLYQIPAFFVGLWVGNGFKKVINLFLISGDERKIDKTIQQLMEETPIVDIIVKYVPSEKVKSDLVECGKEVYMIQLTRAGKGAYKHLQKIAETAKSAADDVIHFAQKQGEQEKQEQEERRKRFDELTKGH